MNKNVQKKDKLTYNQNMKHYNQLFNIFLHIIQLN